MALLAPIGTKLYLRFLKPNQSAIVLSEEPSSAEPSKKSKDISSFVAENIKTLSKWYAHTAGPGTGGPTVISNEERAKVLDKLQELYPENFPLLKDSNELRNWSLFFDKLGSAIVAGGLVVGDLNSTYLYLKNDDSIVTEFQGKLNHFIWSPRDRQYLVSIDQKMEVSQSEIDRFKADSYKIYIDGISYPNKLQFFRATPPDNKQIASYFLKGEIFFKDDIRLILGGYWEQDHFAKFNYKYKISGGELLGPLWIIPN